MAHCRTHGLPDDTCNPHACVLRARRGAATDPTAAYFTKTPLPQTPNPHTLLALAA